MLLSAVGLGLTACAVFFPPEEPLVPGREGRFPHAIHVGDEVGMECVDCHESAESGAKASMPDLELCETCHDEDTDQGRPKARTPAGFVLEGEQEATWSSVTSLSVESTFDHGKHFQAGVACEECHPGVAESDEVSRDLHVGMDACIQCHEKKEVAGVGCKQCHPYVDENWKPASHERDWTHFHGKVAGMGEIPATEPASRCQLCHKESECQSCHSRTEPSDHTEPWRARAHGFSAMMDRDRCITCHKEDSCVRCHNQSLPRSHNAIWGGRTSAHCASCHLPLGEDDSCFTCHRNTRGHHAAPRRPAPPHPGPASDCRECHFPLDHFDNGQSCNFCHR